MSPPTENTIRNVYPPVEMESKGVDRQPTAVPKMTPAQEPAEKADRLRGGCIPCPVRSYCVFGSRSRFKSHAYDRVDAAAAFPYLAASDEPLLHKRLKRTTKPHLISSFLVLPILSCILDFYACELYSSAPPRCLDFPQVIVQLFPQRFALLGFGISRTKPGSLNSHFISSESQNAPC